MNSILSALYRSQLNLDETIAPSHPEYRSLNRKIATMREQWKNRLSEQKYGQLEEMFVLRDKSDGLRGVVWGCRFGSVRMMKTAIDRHTAVRSRQVWLNKQYGGNR